MMNEKTKARAEARRVLEINPKFSLKRYAETLYFRDKSEIDKMIGALREAGLR